MYLMVAIFFPQKVVETFVVSLSETPNTSYYVTVTQNWTDKLICLSVRGYVSDWNIYKMKWQLFIYLFYIKS